MTHHSHAELVSASMPHWVSRTGYIQLFMNIEAGSLKQVQDDGRGGKNGTL
jgi:hypothetical protein